MTLIHTQINNAKRFFIYGAVIGVIAAGLPGLGCSSRNLRRNITFANPPLSRTVTIASRDTDLEAGDNPVEFGTPLLTENNLYLPTETHGLESLDRFTLNRKWRLPIHNGISSQPILEGDTLYFGANDGFFYAVNAEFGKIVWKYETKSPVYSKPIVFGSQVFFTTSDDVIYCLDRSSGKWVWHYKRGAAVATTIHGNSTPFIDQGHVLVGFSDGYFVALNQKDGNLVWESRIHSGVKFTDIDAEPVLDGTRYFVPSYDGGLYALDRSNGKVIWHTDVGGSKKILLDTTPGSKVLYLPASDGRIYCLNKDTGHTIWSFDIDLGTPTNLIQHGPYLAFGSSRQYFYVIHRGNGSLAYRTNIGLRSGFFGTPIEDKGVIYILSNFGNLYGFRWHSAAEMSLLQNTPTYIRQTGTMIKKTQHLLSSGI